MDIFNRNSILNRSSLTFDKDVLNILGLTDQSLIYDNQGTLSSVTLGSGLTFNTGILSADTSSIRSLISGTSPINYNSTTGVISLTPLTTDDISEGTNLYYTNERARAAISATGTISYNSSTGLIKSLLPETTKEPSGWIDVTDSSFSFDNSTRTFTISPTGSSYKFWYQGTLYEKSSPESIQISDVDGNHFIYYINGTLTTSLTPWLFSYVQVCLVHWSSTAQKALIIGEERHGCTMDAMTHERLHNTGGTIYSSGLALTQVSNSGGLLDTDCQISIENGVLYDEDIKITIGTSPFLQTLSPVGQIPVFYLNGTIWVRDTATSFPCKITSGTHYYNLLSGSSWSLSPVTNNSWYAIWIFGTDDISGASILSILGQRIDTSLSDAQANNSVSSLLLPSLPAVEFKLLYRVIIHYKTSYSNSINAHIVDISDERRSNQVSASGAYVSISHNSLSGLSGDDHAQYLNTTRADTWLTTKTTTNLTEGTNLYYTDVRARTSLSVVDASSNLVYDNATGIFYNNSDPSYSSIKLAELTKNRLVYVNGLSFLQNTDLFSWISGTANQISVTDDLDGTVTLSFPSQIINPSIIAGSGNSGEVLGMFGDDHSFIGFYPVRSTDATRKGVIGYSYVGSPNLDIRNTTTAGNLALDTPSTIYFQIASTSKAAMDASNFLISTDNLQFSGHNMGFYSTFTTNNVLWGDTFSGNKSIQFTPGSYTHHKDGSGFVFQISGSNILFANVYGTYFYNNPICATPGTNYPGYSIINSNKATATTGIYRDIRMYNDLDGFSIWGYNDVPQYVQRFNLYDNDTTWIRQTYLTLYHPSWATTKTQTIYFHDINSYIERHYDNGMILNDSNKITFKDSGTTCFSVDAVSNISSVSLIDKNSYEILGSASCGLMYCTSNFTTGFSLYTFTWTKLSLFTTSEISTGVSVNLGLQRFDITIPGTYKFIINASISYLSNERISFVFYKNGSPATNSRQFATFGSGSYLGHINTHAYLTLSTGDYVDCYAINSTSNQAVYWHFFSFSCERVGT